jgi:hypothetical protein
MTIVVKRDADGERIVDLGPVEEYERLLEKSCEDGKPGSAELFALTESMDREQLRHLASILSCLAGHYARLWRHSFTPEFAEGMEQLRSIRRIAKEQGVDLWPELGG